ncbi:MAG TPA: serine hydrolase [Thermoanaerobaculia bacterium]|nr:serine hydrolase [Thermoanaerobaculia bacterium]
MRLQLLLAVTLLAATAQADFREFRDLPADPALQSRLRRAAEESLRRFPDLKRENLGISVVDLTHPAAIARADYNGEVSFYPASVIKIFFMADVFMQGKQDLGDVPRALREMIGVSDNDATAYLVDILAGTCAGTELQGRALRRFVDRRRDINRHFARLGYDIGAMMKPWSFGPYGRELQLLGPKRENRNRLTPNAAAALLLWIARRRAPDAEPMLELLHRPLDPRRKDENQVDEFIGEALPAGSRLWSKAGWTSEVRLDAAYVELPEGRNLVLVIFTRGQSKEKGIVPAIARAVLDELSR